MQANLTAAHKGNLREKFRRRKISLFRKADQRAHIGDAVVYVHIVRNDSCYTYNSTKEEFLPRAFVSEGILLASRILTLSLEENIARLNVDFLSTLLFPLLQAQTRRVYIKKRPSRLTTSGPFRHRLRQ